MSEEDALRWLWLACRVARAVADDASWDELTERQVRLARDAGALSLLPVALSERFGVELVAGNFAAATALVAETKRGRRGDGQSVEAAWCGLAGGVAR